MSVTLSANSLGDRESTATVAPAAARACAIARPMPRPPPVTATVCPYRSMGIIDYFQSAMNTSNSWVLLLETNTNLLPSAENIGSLRPR